MSTLQVNTTAKCAPEVMQAIYGPRSPTKAQDLEESEKRWWRVYSSRKKSDPQEEYTANALVYDPDHLPTSPTKQAELPPANAGDEPRLLSEEEARQIVEQALGEADTVDLLRDVRAATAVAGVKQVFDTAGQFRGKHWMVGSPGSTAGSGADALYESGERPGNRPLGAGFPGGGVEAAQHSMAQRSTTQHSEGGPDALPNERDTGQRD